MMISLSGDRFSLAKVRAALKGGSADDNDQADAAEPPET
jgi:hypothetical protein